VLSVAEINKGGNSRVYKVLSKGGAYALKRYPTPTGHDPRNRQKTEADSLNCMRENGVTCVPEVAGIDMAQGYSLLTWCEGEAVCDTTEQDMHTFADFLVAIAGISGKPQAQALGYASEACVSGTAILSHIDKRLQRLQAPAATHAALEAFLNDALQPALQRATQNAQQEYARLALRFDAELPRAQQVLIPSDFGTHNALRSENGLVFLDFEYFGWDDPATSTANFLLHPAMRLPESQQHIFSARMEAHFAPRDATYAARLACLLPLYAIRWCSIILGEFIPEHWSHRVQSGVYRQEDRDSVQNEQLEKAKALLAQAA
jgi:hypothetical protein